MISSPIPSLLSTNTTMVSSDDGIQSVHAFQSYNMAKNISTKPSDLFQYRYRVVLIRTDQVINTKVFHFLCVVHQHHCKELLKYMRNQDYDYNPWMIAVFFSRDFSPAGAMVHHELATEDCQSVAKYGFSIFILDGQIDTL